MENISRCWRKNKKGICLTTEADFFFWFLGEFRLEALVKMDNWGWIHREFKVSIEGECIKCGSSTSNDRSGCRCCLDIIGY